MGIYENYLESMADTARKTLGLGKEENFTIDRLNDLIKIMGGSVVVDSSKENGTEVIGANKFVINLKKPMEESMEIVLHEVAYAYVNWGLLPHTNWGYGTATDADKEADYWLRAIRMPKGMFSQEKGKSYAELAKKYGVTEEEAEQRVIDLGIG